jgi:nitrogen regulatory protein P-II 1
MAKGTGRARPGQGTARDPASGRSGKARGSGRRAPAGRQLVVCVLNEPEYLHAVLAAFVEAGCTTATVLESQGMGRILSHDMPIFAGFRHLFAGSKPYNHTLFAVVEDPAVVERIVALVRDVLREVEEVSKGVLFTVPVSGFVHLGSDDGP